MITMMSVTVVLFIALPFAAQADTETKQFSGRGNTKDEACNQAKYEALEWGALEVSDCRCVEIDAVVIPVKCYVNGTKEKNGNSDTETKQFSGRGNTKDEACNQAKYEALEWGALEVSDCRCVEIDAVVIPVKCYVNGTKEKNGN